jgi:hypothetical protein
MGLSSIANVRKWCDTRARIMISVANCLMRIFVESRSVLIRVPRYSGEELYQRYL